jgi:RNA polymerase sigma factor (sigma-70 family)
MTDEELLSLIRNDNEKAFETLVYRHNTYLYKFIYARIRSEDDAKDLLQEVLISFWKNRQSVQNVQAYLTRSAYYAIIDWQVQNKKILERQGMLLEENEPGGFSVENEIISREMKAHVNMEVGKVNDMVQKVFISSRWEAKSVREIAEEFGISEQTVKNYISIALKRIRVKLAAINLFF